MMASTYVLLCKVIAFFAVSAAFPELEMKLISNEFGRQDSVKLETLFQTHCVTDENNLFSEFV